MPRAIIINGYPTSGKDTFVELCSLFAHVDNILTSTPAKNALQLLGWSGEKTPEVRDLLSTLMEKSYEMFDGPINYVLEQYENSDAELFFVHVREPHNIKKFEEILPNPLTIFIEREAARLEQTNDSDRNVEEHAYDIIIDNNKGIDELEQVAEAFVKIIKKGLY
jgi:hypothetical protein